MTFRWSVSIVGCCVLGLLVLGGCRAPSPCDEAQCASGQSCTAPGCAPAEAPSATGDLGRYTAAVVSGAGRRVIATYDSTHGNLILAVERPDGALDKRIVDGFMVEDAKVVDRDAGKWPSLAMSDGEVLHLSWYDQSQGRLRYATSTLSEQRFDAEDVDGGVSDRGAFSSLALDSGARPSIAYRDQTARTVRFASRDASGKWSTEKVPYCSELECAPEASDYGEYAQLVIINDTPRVAFYDRTLGALKLAERARSGGEWSVTTIDGGDGPELSDVGQFTAVAVDSNQRLAVAYFDRTRGALRLYRDTDHGTFPAVVDDGTYWHAESQATRGALVGQHCAVAFDDKDNAVIVYLDATGLNLKLARMAGDSLVEIRALSLPAGGHTALARHPDSSALLGAYGAWLPGQMPRTRLELFTLVGQTEAP